MNLKFVGQNLDVTAALKDYTVSKLERIIRHADQVISATVTFSVLKVQKKAEIDLHLSGKDIHIDCVDNDMYAAIDCLMDKLDRAVIKYKEKKQPSHQTPEIITDIATESE
ncbi:MAG: ribosome-associated translation inhibitor RaiA [Snodgrassella sp.]|jgi:putative sigma-54 modulation protein|uniref:Ribosome hibernation promoting factor n=1 Tax=Snodgrassella alvi TaxID=1196083 RepID=A0A2N9XKG2_9NEIS|nr:MULTISPECIES: ribosome-associated translation inhibitor RaiA [Snodgrassella]MCO6505610.1 ribosome-associated translation inhibitor RaiA [Snodgrassella sp.]MCO6508152.1 ribosome-associated translation inhibitor RaiA [Snodgrassella sp.]MCO6513432.1 ribosome-associated translation inhibitor RaiA [Snodgrassella sp.]MCO6515561.1 ribosome-associated translation inhibitor RaiA [Snodgrassella sp.]MCO6519046.1 ribosome-associated translation inhibitor RaiA [Snodgrassella sp.]